MNQILYTGNETNNNVFKSNLSNRKNISIPISIFLILLIIVIILLYSFNVYANSEKDKEISSISNADSFDDTQNIMTVDTSEEINEQIDIIGSKEISQEEKNSEVQYTTSNGESYTVIGTLNIPSLNIEYPILSSTSTELLKISLNKYWGANPNEIGNMVVVGHNYKNDKFFSKLPNIQLGATVNITDTKGTTLNYTVYDTYIIDPYDNACTSQLTDGNIEITLITCYNNGKQRFVAKARTN